jgi:Smg protein
MYLFESYIQVDQTMEIDAQEVTDELVQEGFQKTEIAKALAWLDNLANMHNQDPQSKTTTEQTTSHRIYSKLEQRQISLDCRSYISYLEEAKILTTHTREMVIDCIMSLDTTDLILEDLKWLILMVLFNDPVSDDAFLQLESMLMDFEDGLIH